ncbi:rhodanese-like domain-containing protein [Dyadobacter sp. NIV53]|uniref:rhodanese-like domain-containing protein n=1 Tax=Dyadobacter sp. NIV53 TaxID=2861765 RepID=UPI001C875F59|nr:rhodanese-like domain-containing protein [Dyadobacter sp. NIV53]
MKTKIILVFIFFSALSTAYAQPVQKKIADTEKSATSIQDEVKSGKAYLIDVRTAREYQSGHLKQTRNIDYNSPGFGAAISKLNKTKPVYLYCRSGNRSGKALDSLKALGFKSYYNLGGLEQLKTEGFAAE